ncbi:MAG: hypothetical protein GF419_10150 [Ignavibacteriales bacterium]|nr:hypothetical protein [Ignavibacteriales bacterium]
MAKELFDLHKVIKGIREVVKKEKDYELIIVKRTVGEKDKMIQLKPDDVERIRITLLSVDPRDSTVSEKAVKADLEKEDVPFGHKLAVAIKIPLGNYYVVHPVEFSTYKSKKVESTSVVLRSFEVFATRA